MKVSNPIRDADGGLNKNNIGKDSLSILSELLKVFIRIPLYTNVFIRIPLYTNASINQYRLGTFRDFIKIEGNLETFGQKTFS